MTTIAMIKMLYTIAVKNKNNRENKIKQIKNKKTTSIKHKYYQFVVCWNYFFVLHTDLMTLKNC